MSPASDAPPGAEKRAIEHRATHWIGGKPWDGDAERHGDIYDPATGQVTGVGVSFSTEADAA
jgi:hypothetical protein